MKRGKRKNAKNEPTRRERRLVAERDAAERKAARASRRAHKVQHELTELRSKRRNPRRPPREWWNRCIAGVRHGGGAREPRAVCGAAWWDKPERERAAIVRKLERSRNPRDRQAALALARAEQRHHARRKARNPNAPKRPNRKPRKNPRREASLRENPKQLVSVVYRECKPDDDGRTHDYEHEFRGNLPELVEKKGRLRIKGGSYRMKEGWIHG